MSNKAGQGTKENHRTGQATGYPNSSGAAYRLREYLRLQIATPGPIETVFFQKNTYTPIGF